MSCIKNVKSDERKRNPGLYTNGYVSDTALAYPLIERGAPFRNLTGCPAQQYAVQVPK
jgi:hypothetical protein